MKSSHSQFDSVDDSPLEGIVGTSGSMANVYQLTRISAPVDVSVLLLGETGTGKHLIAGALHQLSQRASGPFIRVNCRAFTDDQLERELFGATIRPDSDSENGPEYRPLSRFEAAQGGTIFLADVNATSATVQAKLLRVLQEHCFERPGESQPVEVNVRLIASCGVDLNLEVTEGRFREDLYWRLNVIPIVIPPVRRREGDIELLVKHFLAHYSLLHNKPIQKIAPDALKALVDYQWPGNVWELQNYIERAVVLTRTDQLVLSLFPTAVIGNAQEAQMAVFRPTDDQSLIHEFVLSRLSKSESDAKDLMKQIVDPVEKELLEQVMVLCNQTRIAAAKKLGMNRNTLYKKLVEHGLATPKSSDTANG